MAREFSRRERVAEELKRELGVLIATQVKDPRVEFVTITDVDVSPDLKHAKVYVGTFDVTAGDDKAAQAVQGLKAAGGYLKKQLSKRLRLRALPDLRFIQDTTERDAQRLDRLIDDAIEQDREHADPDLDESNEDRGPA
ncbi:30S ribosome-binding factor RbfA [Salinisphaera sp. SPP-AMP-43]|uniref:30S ribosome-binding factor RbfA n=1 Tax=Salinisphaera sp. SPP-AMP-43 TaxID=3121288 RepID=UPI003C6E1C5A